MHSSPAGASGRDEIMSPEYHIAFDSLPLPVLVVDSRGNCEFANRARLDFTGRGIEEELQRGWLDDIHPDDRNSCADAYRVACSNNVSVRAEYRIRFHDGSYRRVLDSGLPFDGSGKSGKRILGVCTDVTDVRNLMDALTASEYRFRSLYEHMSEVVALHRVVRNEKGDAVDYRILDVNPAFETIIGIPRTRAIGALASELYCAGEAPYLSVYAQVAATGQSFAFDAYFHPLQKYFRISVFSPERDSFATVSSDISLWKEAERRLAENYTRLRGVFDSIVSAFSCIIEKRNAYTAGHQRRTASIAEALAGLMRIDDNTAESIRIAALIHDIGNVEVPSQLLNKPGKLSAAEFEIVKTHATAGFEILSGIEFPWPLAEIVLQHHERIDGTGYPSGLTGEAIRPEAKILAAADVAEAMSSHRPYRPALPLEAVMRYFHETARNAFDPGVVAALDNLYENGALRRILG